MAGIASRAMRGRDELLASAERCLAAASDGDGRVLLLAGEAGIGKTRLLHALQERAAEQGFSRWAAGAFPQDIEVSAGLVLDLGHAIARSDRGDVASTGQALVRDLSGMPDLSAGAGDAHRHRRLIVLEAVDRLSSLCEDGPALLALEDLHWCDELSLEVVAQLARRVPSLPMLVVGTLRTDEPQRDAPIRAWRSRLLLQRMAEEIVLPRLEIGQTEQLVRDVLPAATHELVELLHRRSGGVPLLVEELATAAAQGHLDVDTAYLPETLAEAIRQRFAELSSPARDAAMAAAVIGRSFDLDLLADVAGRPPDDVAASVDELVDLHFVLAESADWFEFRHALIRDAIMASTPLARRRELHGRVADVARLRIELGGDAYRSAHHEAAGEFDEAAEASAAAASRAVALSAHREALDLLGRAVRCLRDGDNRRLARLLAQQAAEAAATDHNVQAVDLFSRARALLLDDGDVLGAASLLPGLVAARHLLGESLAERVSLLKAGFDEIGDATGDDAQRVRAELMAATAAAYLVDDRLDEAITAGQDALASTGESDERIQLNTAATLGSVLVFAGRIDDGWTRLEESIQRAAELNLEAEAARGYRMMGSSASVLVEYPRAERWLAEGIEYATRTEQWNHRHYMAAHQAHVWWCQGRWDEADLAVQQVLADGEGGITTRITALHVAGFLALGRGQFDSAQRWLNEARAAGEEMDELQRFSPARWGLAEHAVLRRDWAEAVALTDAGYAASHRVADAANLFPYLVTGTRARLAQHDVTAAREWAHAVGTDVLARGIPGTLPAIDHAAGLIELANGRTGKARELLSTAHAVWSERRRWWEAHWCALDVARCAIASNRRPQAAALVAQVRADSTAVAAQPLLRAAAEIASRLDRHDEEQPWSPLTLRELEVARLVARGLTNREIAAELRITVRTAGSHLEHIRTKLGAGRRSEIAAWVTALAPPPGPTLR